jgi:hypothetical protein
MNNSSFLDPAAGLKLIEDIQLYKVDMGKSIQVKDPHER